MIQIKDKLDDEGKLEFASEEQLYQILGLKGEDKCENRRRGQHVVLVLQMVEMFAMIAQLQF
jgi:hypothetical protein